MTCKTHFMNIRVDDESYANYKKRAEERHITLGAYVRLALESFHKNLIEEEKKRWETRRI